MRTRSFSCMALSLELFFVFIAIEPSVAKGLWDCNDLYVKYTGRTEEKLRKAKAETKRRLLFPYDDGIYLLTHLETGHSWIAGKFEAAPVKELEAKAEEIGGESMGGGRFNIVVSHDLAGVAESQKRRLDMALLQTQRRNNGAVFQLLTDTSCFPVESAEEEEELSITQRAMTSAAPGLILRFFGVEGPIDLTENIAQFRKCNKDSGQLSFESLTVGELQRASEMEWDDMSLGVHIDTEIVDAEPTSPRLGEAPPRQCVIQVCTSMLDVKVNDASRFGSAPRRHLQNIGEKMALAAYKGTLCAAALWGEQKKEGRKLQQVFLTLPSDEPVREELEWMARALKASKDFIVAYGLDVTLVIPDSSVSRWLPAIIEDLQKLVTDTRGKYEVIGTSEPAGTRSPQRGSRGTR